LVFWAGGSSFPPFLLFAVPFRVAFKQAPHVVGRTPDKEVSLAFCLDPDGNMIGLMSERALQ